MINNLQKYISNNTDKYFSKTKGVVNKFGDSQVVYAIFVRKPSIWACHLALSWLEDVSKKFSVKIKIHKDFQEGELVAAGDPLFYIEGSLEFLSELETLLLQKVGLPCLCAWNTYMMSKSLKNVGFLSMLARHCSNPDMVYACEYGAMVGSNKAKQEGALGFIGCSTDNSKDLFGLKEGLGTMPHSLIGYAGSTLKATQMYWETYNPTNMTILVDYFGKEITDTLKVCRSFSELAKTGNLHIRLDTHGGRFLEGLNYDLSHDIIEKYVENTFHTYKDKEEINFLIGMGVSAASIFYMRECLDKAGYDKVKIIVSSGFNLKKCNLMANVKAPIDIVGTGSYIPDMWKDTYATADIISYNGKLSVKSGREFLSKKWFSKLMGKNLKNKLRG